MRTIDWTTLTFRDYKHLLIRRKWFIIVPFLFVTVIAVVIAQTTTPVYRTGTMLIAEQIESGRMLDSLLGSATPGQETFALVKQRLL
ncbi:MAG: Wzz/FepE/Etk N-terminal domain-containing protein, partial [Candidatus Poribacteria bacterium]|nr:Wzz/FepE/Etk N-terminal domain-containing protein [Candidatus Poribacteria bacterium]